MSETSGLHTDSAGSQDEVESPGLNMDNSEVPSSSSSDTEKSYDLSLSSTSDLDLNWH